MNSRWGWWGILGLLVSVILALWILPKHMDWSWLKPRLAAIVSEQLGVEVVPRGRLSLEILPQPRITVSDILIAHDPRSLPESDAKSGPELGGTIRWLSGFLEPQALLWGRIEPSSLTIVEADLVLPGRLSTDPNPIGQAVITVEESQLRFLDLPAWAPNSVKALNGVLTIGGKGASLYEFTGEARMRGELVGLSVQGQAGGSLALSVRHGPSASRLSLNGRSGDQESWRGRLSVETEEAGFLSAFQVSSLGDFLGAGPASLVADVSVDRTGGAILVLDAIQSTNLRGSGIVTYLPLDDGLVDVSLTLSRLDFQKSLLDASHTLVERVKSFYGTAELPEILATLRLDRIGFTDFDMRGIRLDGSSIDGRVTLNEYRATLPGGTTLSGEGTIDFHSEVPTAKVGVELVSASPNALLEKSVAPYLPWVKGLPIELLRGGEARADLLLTQGEFQLTNANGWVGDTVWAGRLVVPTDNIDAPLRMELDLDRLSVRDADWSLETIASLNALAATVLQPGQPKDIILFVQEASLSSLPVQDLSIRVSSERDQPAMVSAIANSVAGVSASANLRLVGDGSASVQFDADVPDPVRFLGSVWLSPATAAQFSEFGRSTLSISGSVGAQGGVGYAVALEGEGGILDFGGVLSLSPQGLFQKVTIADGVVDLPKFQVREFSAKCAPFESAAWFCETVAGTLPGIGFQSDLTIALNDPEAPADTPHITLPNAYVTADLGRLGDFVEMPLTLDGVVDGAGSLRTHGNTINSLFTNATGAFQLRGAASFLTSSRNRLVKNVGRLQRRLDGAFQEGSPLVGSVQITAEEVSSTLSLSGEAATSTTDVQFNSGTEALNVQTVIQSPGGETVLSLGVTGTLSRPRARLSGPWVTSN